MRKILGTLTGVLAAFALGGFAIAGSGDGATTSQEAAPDSLAEGLVIGVAKITINTSA